MSSQDDTGPIEIDPDEVPAYDEDDPEGDRREWLESPEHKDIQDLFPDEEPANG